MAFVGGKDVNPFYQEVDSVVWNELDKRAEFYGSRVRSPRVKGGEKGFPEAERLLWSYGKTAYGIVEGSGITLGSSYSRVMSDRKGELSLYDSTRNQPKFPLLQSIELSNEGTIGSLLKGSFTFTIYPDLSTNGFVMESIEKAFFTPGKEVTIKYGWSVRNSGANNGDLTGIIYNFDWSVNMDLSITAKCSVVSKATIAIGVSGEQTNPDSDDPAKDPLGQPIPDGDLAGMIEKDIKGLGGAKNKSIGPGGVAYYPSGSVASKKISYFAIGLPMSIADADDEKLSDADKQKKDQYKATTELVEDKNQLYKEYSQKIADKDKEIARVEGLANSNPPPTYKFTDSVNGEAVERTDQSSAEYIAFLRKTRNFYLEEAGRKLREARAKRSGQQGEVADPAQDTQFRKDLESGAQTINTAQTGSSGTAGTSGTSTTSTTPSPYRGPKPPDPVNTPVYYVKFGDLTEYINKVLEGSSLGDELFVIQCYGNKTQYLPEVVSAAPEEVFFPDDQMGNYGGWVPFKAGGAASPILKRKDDGSLIELGNILISTNTLIETYRSFVKENQTSIEFKNITGFFDALIKKINYASGEMYQLQTQLIDPPKGTPPPPKNASANDKKANRAILSIEDSNISKASIKNVREFGFYATIAKPIMKSVSISCKPPAASAAAAFTEARASGTTGAVGKKTNSQIDVRFSSDYEQKEYESAVAQINELKKSFRTNGAGATFSTGMKGNYAKYKRNSPKTDNTHWLTKVIYPVDFSVTIDGIDGFKFGDVIKTNLIPERYTKEGMVFVVTKINHTIKDGVWETTLNTKARIDPAAI